MTSGPSILRLALSACLAVSPGLSTVTGARMATGQSELLVQTEPVAMHDHHTISAADAAGLMVVDGGSDLVRAGRELAAPSRAVSIVTSLAGSVLDAFLGVGAGAITDAIFGSQTVPLDLTELINDALEEIDRIVGDAIEQAFNAEQQAKLDSLIRLVREYTRRNNLESSRDDIQDMLGIASDLLAFFENNGVVTNAAFQTTLALRLTLLLELFQLDQLNGESPATLTVAENNIRVQAADGKAALEEMVASFAPTVNDVEFSNFRPCSLNPAGGCRARSTFTADRVACMVLESPGLEKPDAFCARRTCRSNAFAGITRKRRIGRCLRNQTDAVRREVERHVANIAGPQFRERNAVTVFGEGFQKFLEDLESVQELDFADVTSLPDIGTAAPTPAPAAAA